jgi:cysteine desulfurase / selenocysteine lyase
MLDVNKIRQDFPILSRTINGYPLVYLDSSATTQKPQSVLDKVIEFYTNTNSNTHRGAHHLSDMASVEYENARAKVQNFINARSHTEVIFTFSTTDAINLVADSFGRAFIEPGDEIIVSEMEHHSNFLPWQALCERVGATLRIAPFDDDGTLNQEELEALITPRTKLIAVTYVSNVLGIANPIKDIVRLAHKRDVPVLVDGAQAVQHFKIDVQDLDCDFFAFSGHKTYAETGVGVLYGKEKWLDAMPPYRNGGGMIKSVSVEKVVYADLPFKFEGGTVNFVAAVSLGAAIDYLETTGLDDIITYEHQLIEYALRKIRALDGVTIYGDAEPKCSVISFNLEGVHPYDAGMLLNKLGIAIRTGNHCAQLVMKHYGVEGTIRSSFAFYNTEEEIDVFVDGLRKAQTVLI